MSAACTTSCKKCYVNSVLPPRQHNFQLPWTRKPRRPGLQVRRILSLTIKARMPLLVALVERVEEEQSKEQANAERLGLTEASMIRYNGGSTGLGYACGILA